MWTSRINLVLQQQVFLHNVMMFSQVVTLFGTSNCGDALLFIPMIWNLSQTDLQANAEIKSLNFRIFIVI